MPCGAMALTLKFIIITVNFEILADEYLGIHRNYILQNTARIVNYTIMATIVKASMGCREYKYCMNSQVCKFLFLCT
jgi:hypothetical protein